jgi:MoaA/NifB/PqqE/SkfB family radical SAM enzyme
MTEALVLQDDRAGFWSVERDDRGVFRWTKERFVLPVVDPRFRFMSLMLASPTAGNTIRVHSPAGVEHIRLLEGWQLIDIRTYGAEHLEFEVSSMFCPPGDDRRLGLMLRAAQLHDDERTHETVNRRVANALLNSEEFASGLEVLQSFPTHLRINCSKRCNIANEKPCVYCSWDWAKRLEEGSPDFTAEVLATTGRFMELALEINDCSYGEPPLESGFGGIVEMATSGGRHFEFTSNGQTLSRKNRQKLLGRTARVHVSIDSATPESYRRYRDHRFELVVSNLRALCAERRATGGLPEVFVSFIVMHSNLNEVSDFLTLMKDVGVDRVMFRTLFLEDRLNERRFQHYGWQFDYGAECLSAPELVEVGERCRSAARDLGMEVVIEWEEFTRNSGPSRQGEPLCSEPWKTAYLLDRGIMPCCYGREPMVGWNEIDQDNLESSLHAAFNSEPLQELRRDLRNGRLGKYCERTQGCPIVKQRTTALAVPADGTRPLAGPPPEPTPSP